MCGFERNDILLERHGTAVHKHYKTHRMNKLRHAHVVNVAMLIDRVRIVTVVCPTLRCCTNK